MHNLDTMSQYALHEFSERHWDGANYSLLFEGMAPHVIPDTRYLACYAHCKWAERESTAMRDSVNAELYKKLCSDYYAKLSSAVRWRRT